MENTLAVPNSLNVHPAALRGRAIGALICGLFGALWIFWATKIGGITSAGWLGAIAIGALLSVLLPIMQLYSLRGVKQASAYGDYWASISKAYWTTVAIEWTACIVTSNWLPHIGRADLIPLAIGIIVGIHFVPLAKIFRAPIYYWTAAAMTLGVLASIAIPRAEFRDLVACGICGLALWVTEGVLLWQYKH